MNFRFDNAGANEDVEQYDDYNYKEPRNKNGDIHLEEGEDEREGIISFVQTNFKNLRIIIKFALFFLT